jgi:hypothetical protein
LKDVGVRFPPGALLHKTTLRYARGFVFLSWLEKRSNPKQYTSCFLYIYQINSINIIICHFKKNAYNMKAGDINKVEPLIKGLIHNAIVDSVDFIVNKCNKLGTSPQEPDFIASLTLRFTPNLFNILKAVFPKNKFSVTGVFCHQKPLANIGLSKSPEIGDILLVYIYNDKKGSKKLNSLLLQAKISTKLTTTISTSDEHQLKLYSEWPKFKYERAGHLNNIERDILPKTINDGGQYLLIDNHPIYGLSGIVGTFPMGCATPAKILSINNDLASEIIDFLKLKSGRMFEETPVSSKDDWTKMIWDILNVTKRKASKRKNSGFNTFPRGVTKNFDGCCFFVTETNSIFRELHNELQHGDFDNNSDNYFDEENFAPSVILIESSEQNE